MTLLGYPKSCSSWGWWFCCCHPKASLLKSLPLFSSIVSVDCLYVIILLMPAGPLLGLLYAFLLLNSSSPVLSLGLYYAVSSFLGSFHCFRAPLSHFILLGILSPFHHFWAPLSHFIFYSFGHPQAISSLLGSFVPFYFFGHPWPISSLSGSFVPFGLLCPILFFWASSIHSNSLLPWAFAKPFGLP